MSANGLPLEHVERASVPWRAASLTECGKPIADLAHVISGPAFREKVAAQGVQRAALTTCMTCAQTAGRWASWDEDPVLVMEREVAHYRTPAVEQIRRELRALGAIAVAHREEFDQYVADLETAIDLRDAAARRRRRTA